MSLLSFTNKIFSGDNNALIGGVAATVITTGGLYASERIAQTPVILYLGFLFAQFPPSLVLLILPGVLGGVAGEAFL